MSIIERKNEIQKPSNSLYQALTWCEYKKCNTIKYLVSSTPNGIINFISEGFGGKTTNAVIVETSQSPKKPYKGKNEQPSYYVCVHANYNALCICTVGIGCTKGINAIASVNYNVLRVYLMDRMLEWI